MDNLVLQTLVGELPARLVGAPVFRAGSPELDAIVLLFDDPGRSRLLLSAAPALPRLHLTDRRVAAGAAPGSFAAILSHELQGAVLHAIEKAPAERVVRFRFAGPSGRGKSLIAELLGRSANLLLLDPEDRVVSYMRRLKSEFRAPVIGQIYEPPRRGTRRDPRDLTEEEIHALAARAVRESHPLADLVLEACASIGRLAAGEIEFRAGRGEDAFEVLGLWLGRAFAPGDGLEPRTWKPSPGEDAAERPSSEPKEPRGYLYAEGDPERLDLRSAPAPGRFLLSPLPLAGAAKDLEVRSYDTLGEGARTYYEALAAGMAFRSRRGALLEMARRETRKALDIASKVRGDLASMANADRDRIYGEALLAGLSRAERKGDSVLVPDPYDPGEALLSVPIDPAVPLRVSADRYFQKHRRAVRGREVAARRLEAQTRRAERLADLASRIEAAAGGEELDAIQHAMRREGIAVGLERPRRGAAAPQQPRESGVRIYRSSDGYEILVGKGGEENDRLTFRIAHPDDFWLHASGASGAHVVIRARRGETRPPPATLREAAELAAWFSRAKGAGRSDVMLTRRKHVHRARGAPRGTVTVKKHETVSVVPRDPFDSSRH